MGTPALFLATVAWQAPQRVYTLSELNVGGSQALLVTTPAGRTLLIDGGGAPSALSAALSKRLPFWRSRLDVLALSDVDQAHLGGLRGLTAHYGVGRALDSGMVYPSSTYALWRAELRDNGIAEAKLRTGARYRLDGAYFDVLQPVALDPVTPHNPVALRLVIGRFSLLLLNRWALDVDPSLLMADGARADTMLVLPAGASDPSTYGALIRLLHPRLVVLPPTGRARDDPTTDNLARRAAHSVGAQTWQGGDGTSLDLSTDGLRYSR